MQPPPCKGGNNLRNYIRGNNTDIRRKNKLIKTNENILQDAQYPVISVNINVNINVNLEYLKYF